jgi:hypothetical protein
VAKLRPLARHGLWFSHGWRRPLSRSPGPPQPAIEHSSEVHLHFHGVQAEDVAAIIGQQEDRKWTDRHR